MDLMAFAGLTLVSETRLALGLGEVVRERLGATVPGGGAARTGRCRVPVSAGAGGTAESGRAFVRWRTYFGADHPAGLMFGLRRKKLSGSYFFFSAANRS